MGFLRSGVTRLLAGVAVVALNLAIIRHVARNGLYQNFLRITADLPTSCLLLYMIAVVFGARFRGTRVNRFAVGYLVFGGLALSYVGWAMCDPSTSATDIVGWVEPWEQHLPLIRLPPDSRADWMMYGLPVLALIVPQILAGFLGGSLFWAWDRATHRNVRRAV